MERKSFKEIKHLLPAESWAAWRNEKNKGEFEEEVVVCYDGDTELPELSLDQTLDSGEFVFLILVKGNLKVGNIYNEDTDGATGLIVLGNLTADNILAGGQEIYVTGNLTVNQLFWGDYNHGTLVTNGHIKARVFISTDYSFDYKRFEAKDRVDVQHLIWDEYKGYEDEEILSALFHEQYLMEPDDEIYSWNSWLDRREMLGALENNKPVLLDSFREEAPIPSFFEDNLISEKNITRFMDSPLLKSDDGFPVKVEYWDGPVFRRVFMIAGQPHTLMIYLQKEEEFACFTYFTNERELIKAYRMLNNEALLKLDENAPPAYHQFFEENWNILLQQFSEIEYYREQFTANITKEKIEELLSLPMVVKEHHDYYNEDHIIEYGNFQWSFRLPGNAEEKRPRITIIKVLGDDNYEFFHFDIEDDAVQLYVQNGDGYEATVSEVPFTEKELYKKAVKYFDKMEKNIRKMNNEI